MIPKDQSAEVDQLRPAVALQVHHGICAGRPRPAPVWARLDEITDWLVEARRRAADPPFDATKAVEWLLDNEYQLRRAVRQVKSDMPEGFYRRLPRLAAPECDGLPRILLAAHGMLEAGHMQVSRPAATQFINAYQSQCALDIAELWAFPAMLRLACLETIVIAFSELIPGLAAPFAPIPEAAYRKSHDPTDAVSRAIGALAAISNIPWKDFFEAVSQVEAILCRDPAGVYARMEFETRDRYRKGIEEIAQGCAHSECEVAEAVLTRARAHAGAVRQGHVGWWLIADGRTELEKSLGFRAPPGMALRRWFLARAGPCYAIALAVLGLAAMVLPVAVLARLGAGPFAWIVGMVLSVIPASIISVTMTQWLVTQLLPPRHLPKLDFRKGLAEDHETVLVIPVIFRSAEEVPDLIDQIEQHWLTNPDPRIRLALLSDPADAGSRHTPDDAPIEAALVDGVRRLNERYSATAPFALLHRRRIRSDAEGCWMGWERKRGKLEQFNAFLLGASPDAFPLREGDIVALASIRHVVTLDADTVALPGSVNRLVGALAHPLNRMEYDPVQGKAGRGYTFIQPRIEISPEAGGRSLFTRLYTGDTAIDIYSRAVSDVYQDLFGEGIFIGKGAYDVAAFRQCLEGRVPENAIVSHDLFEGLFGRTALASDIVFYEGFPASYPDYSRRQHRWIRGDWQLLPWLGRRVPVRGGNRLANPLSTLDRWKILDNLRRSLIAPGLVLLALAGWLALPGQAAIWTLLAVAAPGGYLLTDLFASFARGRRQGTVYGATRKFADHAGRWFLAVIFMAHEAQVALDAIARACWRLLVSHKLMLEWTTAAHVAVRARRGRAGVWAVMAGSPLLAVAASMAILLIEPAALPGAAPLLLLWLAAPEIALFVAREVQVPAKVLDSADISFLRQLARRTLLFFETFAGPEDNWLAPDNFQITPHEVIAHRTSPTSIGMQFLSSLSARDMGHLGLHELATRTHQTLSTLEGLERYRGHVLNWFDTRTLEPLEPRYVSTVDSGNLAVSLLTLREGCFEAADSSAIGSELWAGLRDVLGLLGNAVTDWPRPQRRTVTDRIDTICTRLADLRANPRSWRAGLDDLRRTDWPDLKGCMGRAVAADPGFAPQEVHLWMERTGHHIATMWRDLNTFCPWLELLEAPPDGEEPLARRVGALLGVETPLNRIAENAEAARALLNAAQGTAKGATQETRQWCVDLDTAIAEGVGAQLGLRESLRVSAERAGRMAMAMEFGFLYDQETQTFWIGYNVSFDRMDAHRYDLLASEARLASYFAIAKQDVPAEHWFHLSRPITRAAGQVAVLSWNGSMFEYLMPALLLPSDPNRLLGQSERAAVALQRQYGARLGLPWGVSESAYAARDGAQNYQYRAFGVTGLGLRQGLDEDYVVAPYASALALAVAPVAAAANLRRLAGMGASGRYGFFDALDFTPERKPASAAFAPVQTFMAHHQGMLLAAIGNAVTGNALIERFMRDPQIRAMHLLLQERVPKEYTPETLPETQSGLPVLTHKAVPALQGWGAISAPSPQIHLIGNGRMASWITDTGGGALWWNAQSLTRWTGDPARDEGGARIYLRDTADGAIWSLGRCPPGAPQQRADVVFHADRAEFHQHDHGISASLEITVCESDDAEIRHISLTNDSATEREIELTSYAEVILAPHSAHERHPAFSKLFVHSERLENPDALLFTRRPRRPDDRPPVMLCRVLCGGAGARASVELAGFDTDRRAFLGRHGTAIHPSGLSCPPSSTAGWTLDPVAAQRVRVRLQPGERAELVFVTIAAGSRETALDIAERFGDEQAIDWHFHDAVRSTAIQAHRVGLTSAALADAQSACRNLLMPPRRTSTDVYLTGLPGQNDLWGLGLSGDLPIIVVRVSDAERAELLPVVVRAHQWWRRHGLRVDLVVLSTAATSYEEPIRTGLSDALRDAGRGEGLGGPGGVHLHSIDRIAGPQLRALETLAQVTFDGTARSLASARTDTAPEHNPSPPFAPMGAPARTGEAPPVARPQDLTFDNGYGGFTADAAAYLIHLEAGMRTPVPWSNVLANDGFGSLVTEAGLGFTWGLNSGEHRITPWSNDPVADPQSEALYLRDEETAQVWTPTPQPAGGDAVCQITHEPGVTKWVQNRNGLSQELCVFVPPDAPVKLAVLSVTNHSGRPRQLTATYYAEWVMGALAGVARAHVVCGYHAASRALIARNGWVPEFADRIAFLTASRPAHSLTCARDGFLGREGDRAFPEGLARWDLGNWTENVADPCAAFQVYVGVADGENEEVVFVLGEGRDLDEMEALAAEWSAPGRAAAALVATRAAWNARLGAVQVETPDPAFNIMINRWLPCQTIASRILARAGFQQASGGIGFRDQLQDMMALLFSDPGRVRAHLLDCAARQFEEGDVLHWWHPPAGRGVRTRCSDDLMWLTYATSRYVAATGDAAILDEEVPFLSAPPLTDDEDDRYALFEHGAGRGTLFEHCRRAMDRGVTTGAHGLPLIGAGDWNDAMDRVGTRGRGESVWLAWFAATCSDGLAGLAGRIGRAELVDLWRGRADNLRRAADQAAWDGAWYVRAYDDDGVPWGSKDSDECRIDSISQSWAVLCGSPARARAAQAITSASERLVNREHRLVRLLTPPFDRTPRDPGYIRGYPPGVRENGGQYTHAATWLGFAHAGLGDGDAAHEIFDLVNPIRRTDTRARADLYRGEPYIAPADVRGAAPFEGQAGWTWYTGSAAWIWRLGVEAILGLELRDGQLWINPCLPKGWGGFKARIDGPDGSLFIELFDPEGISSGSVELIVDGKAYPRGGVGFPSGGAVRQIRAQLV